jgi:hypothetical protein
MKVFVILIIFTINAIANSYNCDIKQCAKKHLDEGICVTPTIDTEKNITIFDVNINNCKDGKFCPYAVDSTNSIQCSDRPTIYGLFDGQSCTNNTQCASNDCHDSKCLGKAESAPCNQNSECRIGYFCGTKDLSSGIKNCLKQRSANETCETDEDCVNNMGCLNQKCAEYFSATVGTQMKNGNWRLCETGKVYDEYCVSIKLSQESDECKGAQVTCEYTAEGLTDRKVIYLMCQCSNAYSDKNFCDIDNSKPEWIKFIEKLKDWYAQHNKNYHTDNRHIYHMDLYKMYKTMTEYPQHKDAENCLVDWEMDELNASYLRYGFAVLFALAILDL